MKNFRLIILLLVIISCSERTPVPSIELLNPDRTKEIYLSEILHNIQVIRLETSENILLGENTNYLVSERYIITIDNEKILLFSNEGNFIKVLAIAGNGPEEFIRAEVFAIDGEKDILYINHRGDRQHILVYDLKEGKCINRIPTGVDNLISRIIVMDDSVLTIVPRLNKEYNLYYITTSGRFLYGITPPVVKGIGLETSIQKVMNDLFYMPKEYDTLYSVNKTTKKPYCFFIVDDRFTFENNETGNFVYLSLNAPTFMIANKAHASIKMNPDGETYTMSGDKVTLYWIDKRDFSVKEIKGFHNDYFGIDEEFDPFKNYIFINNNLAFVKYSSFNLKQLIKKSIESKTLNKEVMLRISALNDQINENDNPVLVIGKLKTD
ncbi:MAG: 6-bladed beta-propeller [Ignavibacteriales bacterium]|nr:MAG: 6-bladed beta-propeller [Ignavibacteriales bacterium]